MHFLSYTCTLYSSIKIKQTIDKATYELKINAMSKALIDLEFNENLHGNNCMSDLRSHRIDCLPKMFAPSIRHYLSIRLDLLADLFVRLNLNNITMARFII